MPADIAAEDKVNVLLVDDQPAKLLSYEVILAELGENLVKADSPRAALEQLLKHDVAVILIDVCMPELDGFELAAMIREHPRFAQTAIIFISAIHLTDLDRLRGYECGAVDYIPVPVVPEILRAKVKVFTELHRKTRQLERLNAELEQRVAERTAALEASTARLRHSEERLRLAQEARGIVTWDWEIDGDTGPAPGDLLGLLGLGEGHPAPTEGARLRRLSPEDAGAVEAALAAAAAEGRHLQLQYRIDTADGGVRWFESFANPLLDAAGRVARLVGVTYEVTEQRQAREALEQLNAELEVRVQERTDQLVQLQKTEALGQLTGGIAHDFNNLLAAILTSLELLKHRLGSDPKTGRILDSAIQGVDRGAALTRRMLAFARRQELKPVIIRIPELLDGMEDLLDRSIGPQISVVTDISPDVGPAHVDRHQLEVALLNLAVNARDAMPDGGTLIIRAADEQVRQGDREDLPPGRYVRLSVSDTGAGMDEATLARATEPFFTTKEVGKGTGLGLSMVHGLVTQSGGAMSIRSRPGEGTTVTLWLPQSETSQPLAPANGATVAAAADSMTILVVDDDALVRIGLAGLLEHSGHEVIEAASAAEALRVLQSGQSVDLLITDQAMPGMTGYGLISEVERRWPGLPTILATGFAEMPVGAEDLPLLSKPFDQHTLANAILAARSRRRQTRVPRQARLSRTPFA